MKLVDLYVKELQSDNLSFTARPTGEVEAWAVREILRLRNELEIERARNSVAKEWQD